jgi:hypothetical protein
MAFSVVNAYLDSPDTEFDFLTNEDCQVFANYMLSDYTFLYSNTKLDNYKVILFL